MRNVETADGHVARRLTVGYVLVSSGTCQSNVRDEVPQADCEIAATSLGLDTTVEIFNSANSVASGCLNSPAQGRTIFVTNSVSNDCGTAGYDCICAVDHSNAGNASLHPLFDVPSPRSGLFVAPFLFELHVIHEFLHANPSVVAN